jgi:two-component sensor histidine kinase
MSNQSRKNLNKEFQAHYLSSSLPGVRLGFTLMILTFSVFALFNNFVFPGSPEQLFYNRYWIISPFLVIAVVVTYIPLLQKWLQPIYIVLNICIALVIFYIGITASPLLNGFESYYAWVMLVIIGFFTFFRMPLNITIIIAGIQFLAFVLAILLNGSYLHNPFTFFNNIFYVVTVYLFGFIMVFMFRKLNWKNFLHAKAHSENYKKMSLEVKERKQAEQLLKQSQFMYINTINSIPDWIYVVDKDLRFVILNTSLQEEHLRQGFPVNCIGKKITRVYPYIPASTLDEINQVFKTGQILIGEQQFFLRDKTIFGETRKVPIFKENEVHQVMTIMRNRSKEKEIEELKQKNIEQKEIMLREIHHRVKNNLAIVISLLNLQLRNNKDPELHRIICDIEMRIRSMALIHEHLYRSDNLDRIPLASYLRSLLGIIMGAFSDHKINMVHQLEPVDVNIEIALPLGLIANELITNAFKYAFPGIINGEIQVQLIKESDDQYMLIIKDNGVGLPATFSMDSDKSLGLFIVRLLVEQLGGSIEIDRHNGTAFTIRFVNSTVKKNEILMN